MRYSVWMYGIMETVSTSCQGHFNIHLVSRLTSTQFLLVIKVHHSKVSIEETGNKITPALDLWVLGLLSLSQTEQE